jgi:glucan-binding YG repeat protein
MLTGWQHIGDYWYYFHDTVGSGLEGAMYVSDKDGKQFIATFDN